MPTPTRRLAVLLFLSGVALAAPARAQNKGFQIDRYEPTPAGEWSFMVDHPWYSSTRWFAGGLTLNYGHDPLVYGRFNGNSFDQQTSVIKHQLVGHVDLAGSFLDRVTINASLPITFLERGTAVDGVRPLGGAAVGDLRLGAMVRLWRHAEKDPFSIHLGINFWVPFGQDNHQGDDGIRVMPKLVVGGYAKHIRWSADFAFYYRPEQAIGASTGTRGNKVGSEIQIGALLAYADQKRGWSVGPEALLSTVVLGGDAFGRDYTSLEVLAGAHYHLFRQVLLGAAAGIGVLREPGTPDFRILFRAAYAPERHAKEPVRDRDGDGIIDSRDACPDAPEDKDGFEDTDGCPDLDNDKDGIPDRMDMCPLVAEDRDGFEDEDGCPDPDNDKDGILDVNDRCPNEPEDKDGFEDTDGCPDPDNDKDGILDVNDRCPNEPGPAENQGCPDKDRDGDTVVDRLDNCPDEPGDPKNHGCKKKQRVEIRNGRIEILEQVFFDTDKDVIQARSFPLLKNVADVLKGHPDLHVLIEGHTDSQGKLAHNMDLSDRRAASVKRFLVKEGVDAGSLTSKGFGPTQPIADNKTTAGRALNRRVVFTIVSGESGSSIQNKKPGADAQGQ